MSAIEGFVRWAESKGAEVEIMQDDDGSGYTVVSLILPSGQVIDLTVTETP